jgi:integrase/recombinase XerC
MIFGVAIEEFAADLQLAGRATGTVEKHKQELSRLELWLDGRIWSQLSRSELKKYVRTRAGLAPSTRANMLCSLRTFFRWAVEQGYVASSPAIGFVGPQKPQPQPRALSIDQVRRLVSHLGSPESRAGHRDRALILTGLYAGLRAGELAGLRWPAIDIAGGVINIRLSKMGRGRAVKLHPVLAETLTSWGELQGLGAAAPVFSLDSRPISANRVGKIARRISAACGVQFSPHTLRHTFATWSLRRSGNVYAVSKALGHAALKQTEVYLRTDPADGAPAVDSLPALDSW